MDTERVAVTFLVVLYSWITGRILHATDNL